MTRDSSTVRPGSAIVSVPATITPEWLTEVLHGAGLPADSAVVEIATEPVGEGLMADLQRLSLRYDGDRGSAPTTVIAKRPALDAGVAEFAGAIGLYSREVRFYREVAPSLSVRTPRLFHGALADDNRQFLLLLEDIAPVQSIDQAEGCTADQAALVMEQAGRMHRSSWEDPRLLDLAWLRAGLQLWTGAAQQIGPLAAGFRQYFNGRLEEDYLALADTLVDNVEPWLRLMDKPRCLWHGDFRLDNIGFGLPGSDSPLVVYDWQVVTLGAPAIDVSYFLGSGLRPQIRQAHEQELVRIYFDSLTAGADADYSWNECFTDYRRHSIAGFLGILLAFAKAARTEQSDLLLLNLARAYGRQVIDCDAFGAIES